MVTVRDDLVNGHIFVRTEKDNFFDFENGLKRLIMSDWGGTLYLVKLAAPIGDKNNLAVYSGRTHYVSTETIVVECAKFKNELNK